MCVSFVAGCHATQLATTHADTANRHILLFLVYSGREKQRNETIVCVNSVFLIHNQLLTKLTMTDLKFVVTELNKQLNTDYNLISFDSLPIANLVQLLVDVLHAFDATTKVQFVINSISILYNISSRNLNFFTVFYCLSCSLM